MAKEKKKLFDVQKITCQGVYELNAQRVAGADNHAARVEAVEATQRTNLETGRKSISCVRSDAGFCRASQIVPKARTIACPFHDIG
jgi:hypothetical protein